MDDLIQIKTIDDLTEENKKLKIALKDAVLYIELFLQRWEEEGKGWNGNAHDALWNAERLLKGE
jgi:hypothetical protein